MLSTVTGTALYPPAITPPKKPLPLYRLIYRLVRNPLQAWPQAVYEEPMLVVRGPRGTAAWVADPALVDELLVQRPSELLRTRVEQRVFQPSLGDGVLTSDGALWRWQRRILAPLFRPAEIMRYAPAMTGAAEETIAKWRVSPPGSVQQIDSDMVDTTFAVIARTMLAGGEPREAAFIKRATGETLAHITWDVMFGLMRVPDWIPHPRSRRLRHLAYQLRQAVRDIVARRQANADGGADSNDLLGRLLAARHPDTGAPMTMDQLIDNVLTLLEAGHETTSRALAWTLYLLARAPEWQEKVRAEALAVAGREPIGASHAGNLPVTLQVLKEAMRLYPPVPAISRRCPEPITIGGKLLPAETTIIIPIFAIHRHRRLWTDPARFDPTRFTAEREASYPRTQFMPFGAGPRLCLGQSFAMLEATVILATLIRAARFDWDGVHLPEPVSRVTLQPRGGMPLKVTLQEPAL